MRTNLHVKLTSIIQYTHSDVDEKCASTTRLRRGATAAYQPAEHIVIITFSGELSNCCSTCAHKVNGNENAKSCYQIDQVSFFKREFLKLTLLVTFVLDLLTQPSLSLWRVVT